MSMRARRPVSSPAETSVPAVVDAPNPAPRSKIARLGTFAALFVVAALAAVAALPINPQADVHSTLQCYDSAGKNHPCLAHTNGSPSGATRQTAAHLPGWIVTALYQVDDHPGYWTASATSAATASAASAPTVTAQRSMAGKHLAAARCGRHLIPCFFSAVGRGLTHIASLAAAVGRPQPAREHL